MLTIFFNWSSAALDDKYFELKLLDYLFLSFERAMIAVAWEASDKYNLLNKEILWQNNHKIIPTINKIKKITDSYL